MTFALVAAMALAGCTKEYTITVQSNNLDWGTVTGSGTYADGSTVQISAIPASGYYFISWQDGDRSNPRTITVTGNATYIATFSNDPNGGGGEGGDGDPLTMSGTISNNVTWVDRGLTVDYIIDGELLIDGNALLTIDPGVTIMFTGVGGGIYVGENAGLRMVGTSDKPIILQGPTNNPNNGSWNHVYVTSMRNDNQFEYVQFLRGGSGNVIWEGVIGVSGRLSMKHCTIDGSLCGGVVCDNEGYLTAFENNVVKNCAKYPMYYSVVSYACKGLGSGNNFSNNAMGNVVFVYDSYFGMTENLTLANIGFPYRLNNGMSIGGTNTFTIEAGTVIEMAQNTDIYTNEAAFVANGTASNPIIFRSAENGENWNGIKLFSSKSANSMSYCQIKNCGTADEYGSRQCLYINYDTKMTLTNNTFGPSAYYGVVIDGMDNFGNITHSGNTFQNCAAGNVLIEGGGEYGGTEYEDGQVLNDLP